MDMEKEIKKIIWDLARIIKLKPELIAEAPEECETILKAAYSDEAFKKLISAEDDSADE